MIKLLIYNKILRMKNELQFDLNNYFKQFPLIQDHVKYTSVLDKGNIFDCVKLIKK